MHPSCCSPSLFFSAASEGSVYGVLWEEHLESFEPGGPVWEQGGGEEPQVIYIKPTCSPEILKSCGTNSPFDLWLDEPVSDEEYLFLLSIFVASLCSNVSAPSCLAFSDIRISDHVETLWTAALTEDLPQSRLWSFCSVILSSPRIRGHHLSCFTQRRCSASFPVCKKSDMHSYSSLCRSLLRKQARSFVAFWGAQ